MSAHTPTVLEIDRKLRDDFRRRVKDFGVVAEATDPLLAVLFRTFAQQIDQVYGDTALLRQSLLHELMRGLQVQQYLATPAQAAIRLNNQMEEPRVLRAGTELNAVPPTGERMVFSLDATCEISKGRIAFALSYQDQAVRLLSGVEMSDAVQAQRPSMEAIPIALGPQPALYLAIENLPGQLLNRHGIFFELGPGTYAVQHALCHEPWWIFDEAGELSGSGLLRPFRSNAGVYQLRFQTGENEVTSMLDSPLPSIPDGFYAGRQFVFPAMAADAPFRCRMPRLLEPALTRLLHRNTGAAVAEEPRFWIKIPMPPGVPALHHAIGGIVLHAMTASNVFARNQTVQFARDGTSIPVTRDSGTPEHLVAPLTVMSTENDLYEAAATPSASATAGRFELHNNRLTITPGHGSDGTPHTAANVRLWLTNGALGNRVGPGDITGFANAAAMTGVRVAPLTAASGGSDGEDIASEERRFADALLTRGRIVTKQDLKTAALAIDRRILEADSASGLERGNGGLHRVERLRLTLDADGFSRPEIELPALKSQIEVSLSARLVQGLQLAVEFTWNR